jgi:plasmid maintenance system antidote protein VapI
VQLIHWRLTRIIYTLKTISGASALGMSPRFWLGLQMDYDLDVAEDEMGDRLSQEVVALANQS